MSLDEAGHGQMALQVDDPGGRADVGLDLAVAPYRDDPVVLDRQGLRLRDGLLQSDDLAVLDDEIGRLRRLAARGEDGDGRQ